MPKTADEPLQKITINIYLADYVFITQRYGQGYQELVRQFIRDKVKELQNES